MLGQERRFGAVTGALLVIASMVGLGAFTTTGFLLRDLESPLAVLSAWLLGGALSLCGALAYAELVTMFPFNGGEYQLLSRIYGPGVGFVAGWVSLWVGFSAPTAAAAFAFGEYASGLLPIGNATTLALALVLAAGLLQGLRVGSTGRVQNLTTALEIVLMLAFIAAGGWRAEQWQPLAGPPRAWLATLSSPAFAVSIIYVGFAYSGWNAAAYLAGEVRDPHRTLPRALIGGTLLTTLLYVGLNFVFALGAPASELAGQLDVARIASAHLFGPNAARLVSALIALALAVNVGALLWTGPRVYEAMGRDYPRLLGWVAARHGREAPVAAIALQALIAVVLLVTSSFEAVLSYAGLLLSVFAGLTIAGVFVLRRREPGRARPYRAWGHPGTSLVALALMSWTIVHTVRARPAVLAAAAATLISGWLLYRIAGQPRARGSMEPDEPGG